MVILTMFTLVYSGGSQNPSWLELARSDQASLQLVLEGRGLIPTKGHKFAPVMRKTSFQSGCHGFSLSASFALPHFVKGPFICTFQNSHHINNQAYRKINKLLCHESKQQRYLCVK